MRGDSLFSLLLTGIIGVLVTCCASTEVVKPDHVGVYEGKSILVTTKGGAKYYFAQGTYSIAERLGDRVIKGKGPEIESGGVSSSRFFDGEMSLDEIATIEVREMSTGFDGRTIAVCAIIGAIAAGIVYMSSHNFGHW